MGSKRSNQHARVGINVALPHLQGVVLDNALSAGLQSQKIFQKYAFHAEKNQDSAGYYPVRPVRLQWS